MERLRVVLLSELVETRSTHTMTTGRLSRLDQHFAARAAVVARVDLVSKFRQLVHHRRPVTEIPRTQKSTAYNRSYN